MRINSKLYNTPLFKDVFGSLTNFKDEWEACEFYSAGLLDTKTVEQTYALLLSEFANTPISGWTKDLWKLRVFSTMFQYAPTWQAKLKIQEELRELTLAEIMQGSKVIYNRAANPDTTPKTGDLTELEYINEQNVSNYKKSKIEAYLSQWEALNSNLTKEYISKYKNLFLKIVSPQDVYLFEIEEDE